MRNHLFIGLGGQGGKTIAELRKVFEAREGDARFLRDQGVQWDFLYIDSSRDVTNSRANWIYFGKNLQLPPDSFLDLKEDGAGVNARQLAMRPDVSPWIGDVAVLESFLQGVHGIQGANQRRRFGRILFANNTGRIERAICDQKVAPMLVGINQCAFHIFATLAGGTGSGGVVELVTMLRTRYPNASVDGGFPIFLYLYITSDDFEEAQVGYFHQNQYSTLRDLNALAVGCYCPHLLGGGNRGGELFNGREPITQIILSTSLNDRNQRVPLPRQHKITAEATFERIYAYCSGNLNEAEQKPLTGEDRFGAFPGEPLRGPLRSFRFGSVGMKRWEVPTEQVHDLLANELYVATFRRLLYQNWNARAGFLAEKLPQTTCGANDLCTKFTESVETMLVERVRLPRLVDSLGEDFGRAFAGMKQDGFKGMDLDDIEERLRGRFRSNLAGTGAEAVLKSIANERAERLGQMVNQIHALVVQAWTRPDNPIGLAYVADAVLELQESIRGRLNQEANSLHSPGDQPLRSRMEARKQEWGKMTFCSRPIRAKSLAEAHRNDLVALLSHELRIKCRTEDHQALGQLVGALGKMAADYRRAVGMLEEWNRRKSELRYTLLQDISRMHGEEAANLYELNRDALEAYMNAQRVAERELVNASDQLLKEALLPLLGTNGVVGLGYVDDQQQVVFWEEADKHFYGLAKQIHDAVVDRLDIEPVLSGDLMTILMGRCNADGNAFNAELREFINSATCSARVDDDQLQPKDIIGDDNMPRMPRKALVVGVPKGHTFSQTLAARIRPLMPAGDTTVLGVYEHDERTQIRLFSVTSWMAGRFNRAVHDLHGRYVRAVGGHKGNDTAYFTNLDPSGEHDQRPPLLLPSPEEQHSAMRAALWAGTRLPAPDGHSRLVEADGNRVVLLRTTNVGLQPKLLGASLEALGRQCDIRTICAVIDEVSKTINSLSVEELSSLGRELENEDSLKLQQFGAASAEYEAWAQDRSQIRKLLNR